MFNLVYASTAARAFSNAELFGMLERWRTKNARLGITGLLIFRDGAFIQSLEGDEPTVRALYAQIRVDERHFQVVTIQAVPIPKRHFADWSMGFKNLDGVDVTTIPGYNPHPKVLEAKDGSSAKVSVAMGLLACFAQEN